MQLTIWKPLNGREVSVMSWLMRIVAFFTAFIEQMKRHPKGFRYIFFGELAERSAYYGGAVLLAKYTTDYLGLEEGWSGTVIHLWKAFCYLLPIAGGYLADRYLGRFKAIIYLAPVYVLGAILLGYWQAPVGLYVALALLAVGSGIVKPNVSPLMGRMYKMEGLEGKALEEMKALRADAFSKFYASINIGAFLSISILPTVRSAYGYQAAFSIPVVIMILAFLVFWFGRKYYPDENLAQDKVEKQSRSREDRAADRKIIFGLLGIFLSTIMFWATYEQYSTTWIWFAQKNMNLHGLPADQLQIINPFMVIFLSLFFFSPFWAWVDKRRATSGKPPLAFTQKMKAGFVLMIVASLFLAFSGLVSTEAYKPSCVWQMVAIALMTVAELCVATIGLESAFNEAPKHLQSSLTGIFLAMIFLGNILASALMPVYTEMNPSAYFFLMAGITAAGLLMMFVLSGNFERKKREQFNVSAKAADM